MARRGHHEGSIRKRPDGRWEARVSTGTARVSLYGKTRAEVARKLALALGEIEGSGGLSQPSRIRLGEFLEEWLETAARPRVKDQTYENYERLIRCHLVPRLGGSRLAELDARTIQGVWAAMLRDGFSPATINSVRSLLRNALREAVTWRMLQSNPAAGTSKLRETRRHETPWTAEQARTFLDSLRGDRLEALFFLALSLGLRKGELIGLRWSDLDLDGATITVARTAGWIDGAMRFSEPKTRRSQRTLRLPARAVELLREHAKREPRGELVFVTASVGAIHPTNLWEQFLYRSDRAGLPRIRFHDLRHICATLLLGQGIDLKVVSEILGHASVATTADRYAHVLPSLRDEAARRMDQLLNPPKEGPAG